MSEFQEVMKQWRRMCKAQQCSKCPLDNAVCCISDPYLRTDVEIETLEELITNWAEEHPEPVYPKWWEWLADQGILTCDKTYPNMRYWYALNKDKVEQPIPADIAQKLGLELRKLNGES